MNSNYGRSSQSGSLNNFDFDFGINSNRSKSLIDQKNKTPSYSSSSSFPSTQPKLNTTSSWQPNKPSWTHQPIPSQTTRPGSVSGPTSMVGDITGKSWTSSVPPSTTGTSIGIVNKNPNLFSDLLGPSLGQNKGDSNVPLKNATPISTNKSAYSMGGMADSLPKSSNSVKSSGNWGSSENFGNYNTNAFNNNKKNQSLGGPSMKTSVGSAIGGGMSSNKDPFGSLVDFSSMPAPSIKPGDKVNIKSKSGDGAFGSFQNATNSSTKTKLGDEDFGNFQNATKLTTNAFPANTYSKMDDFGIPSMPNHAPVQSSSVDAFDVLFSSTDNAAKASDDFVTQQFSGADDWGFEPEIGGGGGDMGGSTTELEGLPPPPSGVSASSAKNKGMDNYKQGQYPDAIKWLSWAVILLEKAGDSAGTMEVLSSRASCYKEVGEYKKAVADCTKVLEEDGKNVSVLVQRALLYESMEKYKLGAEDLRIVMKLDPGNRVARSTIHRLTKMAG